MLYEVLINEWEEVTYVPTPAGKALLAALIAALLAGAVWFARRYAVRQAIAAKNACNVNGLSSAAAPLPAHGVLAHAKSSLTARQLAFCAMSVALGTVLSNIKLFQFPFGGSVTLLSMFVICLPGYFFGMGAGILSGLAYGVLQLIIDPYVLFPMQLVTDYLLAFGALGLSGLFTNARYGLIKGYLAGVTGRYVFSVISGCIFFASYAWEGWDVLPYSLVYNGIYIYTEAAATLIILAIPSIRNDMARIKQMALS